MLAWTEKYRPRCMDDITSQEEVVNSLKNASLNGSLSHLLFHGPPGTGKTSTILALCRELYESQTDMNRMVLKLNASDDRDINVVRNKIKNFARIVAKNDSLKIIILDEADSMTDDAQFALRRIIEKYTKYTRFCLICNYVSKIIEPLISRCSAFRFKPLPKKLMTITLQNIANLENLKLQDELSTLNTLIDISKGDMRKAITLLQSASQLNDNSTISSESIIKISGILPNELMEKVWKSISEYNYDTILKQVDEIISSGYSTILLIDQLGDLLLKKNIPDEKKKKMALLLAQVDKRLEEGADEELQLINILLTFSTYQM